MVTQAPAGQSRREAQREERRAAILAIARQAFHDHGYGGTTMSGIAAALGGSKGTLWAYFSSKEELFAATLDGLIAEFAPTLSLDPELDPRTALIDYCVDFLTMMLSPAIVALNRLIVAEAPRFPELGRIFYERAPRRRHRAMADYLEIQMREGRLKVTDPMLASSQLHHLCQSRLFIQTLWGLNPAVDAEEIRRDAAASVRLFLDGYAADQG